MPTARAKKETATTTRKVATKVDTKVTAEEQVIAEKPIEEKMDKISTGINIVSMCFIIAGCVLFLVYAAGIQF